METPKRGKLKPENLALQHLSNRDVPHAAAESSDPGNWGSAAPSRPPGHAP